MSTDPLAARLLALFRAELADQLRALNADLLALEAEPGNAERLGSLFRIVHTLKGAAHAAQVPQVEGVCHLLESFLALVRDDTGVLEPPAFTLLFDASDALADAGERLRTGRDLGDSPVAALETELRSHPPRPGLLSLQRPWRGSREAGGNAPDVRDAQPVGTAPPAATTSSLPPDAAREHVRVTADKLDALGAAAGQLLITSGRLSTRPAELEELCEFAGRWRTAWRRGARRLRLLAEEAELPAAVRDTLAAMDESLQRMSHEADRLATEARADAQSLSGIANELADRVRRLRLSPFADACVALPRAVRDLAAASGKEVRLEFRGGEVEADRAVLDILQEPLLQLVRNAVDHGIESPGQRDRKAKPRVGTIIVSARLIGSRLTVTVEDDGVGLDLDAIRLQRERRGLGVGASEEEIVRSLFLSGFSTRDAATSISGRGVGLDVVRTTIERIRGSVQVNWTAGQGTRFILECPPTLATIRAVLASLGTTVVAVPSVHVEHLGRVRPEEVRRAEGRDVLITAAAPVPLASLARLLGPPLPDPAVRGTFPVVRLEVGGQRLAVVVDELISEEEIVVRPLDRLGSVPRFLSGAALLPTGQVALVINAAALVADGHSLAGAGASLIAAAVQTPRRRRVLVVDDSITTRTLEQTILQTAGFDVLVAVDGMDAWRMLQERECDLVLSDVEMPRMNGFELCRAIRGSSQLSGLPIVLVSALESPEDRARGLEAGADAYLPKSRFDQHDLLDAIQQLIA